MESLTLIQKKYAYIKLQKAVDYLLLEGKISPQQAEKLSFLNAQTIGVK